MKTEAKTKQKPQTSEQITLPSDPARRAAVLALLQEDQAIAAASDSLEGESPAYVVEPIGGSEIKPNDVVRLLNGFGQERQATAMKSLGDGTWLVCYGDHWYLASETESRAWPENGRETAIKLDLASEPEGEAESGEETAS